MRSRPKFMLALVVLAGSCGNPNVVTTSPASQGRWRRGWYWQPAGRHRGWCGCGRGGWRVRAPGRGGQSR